MTNRLNSVDLVAMHADLTSVILSYAAKGQVNALDLTAYQAEALAVARRMADAVGTSKEGLADVLRLELEASHGRLYDMKQAGLMARTG